MVVASRLATPYGLMGRCTAADDREIINIKIVSKKECQLTGRRRPCMMGPSASAPVLCCTACSIHMPS